MTCSHVEGQRPLLNRLRVISERERAKREAAKSARIAALEETLRLYATAGNWRGDCDGNYVWQGPPNPLFTARAALAPEQAGPHPSAPTTPANTQADRKGAT